jgi:hypothetical protein
VIFLSRKNFSYPSSELFSNTTKSALAKVEESDAAIASILSKKKGYHESKIVTRFWIVGIASDFSKLLKLR